MGIDAVNFKVLAQCGQSAVYLCTLHVYQYLGNASLVLYVFRKSKCRKGMNE